jgi:long-chain acyl-CoA synthetase
MASPLQKFYHWEQHTPDHVFLRQPLNGQWITYSFRESADQIRRMAAALRAFHLDPGSKVAILSKNCAHWVMADLAIWMAGYVSVPLYPTLSAATIRVILDHSECSAIFLGKLDDFESQKAGIPSSIHQIAFPLYGMNQGYPWDDLLKKNTPLEGETFWDNSALATIMYTSGTTGQPKGVMANFVNLDYVVEKAQEGFKFKDSKEKFFSYLPLSHIAERALVEMGALYSGSTISFSESLEKFPMNLMHTQPTVFLAVPRIWSKFQEKILEKMPQKKLDRILRLPLISPIFKKIIRKRLGLARARWIFTGAAPISKALLEWYYKLGIMIFEAYGMTENMALSHLNMEAAKFGTVGKPWPGIQWRLTNEKELVIKHPGIMMGYYKAPEMTADVFTPDGYFKTGDKGEVDKQGNLTITGRVKDLFKTDKGKYISPLPIELELSINADIEQVCVVGMGIPQPIALVTLSASGKTKSQDQVQESLTHTLQKVNQLLESYEKIAAAVILKQDWTIENGLMTPTLKVKRPELEKIFLPSYPKWFNAGNPVVWE